MFQIRLFCSVSLAAVLLSGCAIFQGYDDQNTLYTQALVEQICDVSDDLERVQNGKDVIYTGLNAGLTARNCKNYKVSNQLFDYVEQSFKDDVELQGVATKATKVVSTTVVNENLIDYEGMFFERIMLNTYKGLNFANLGDYNHARVEFNRALERQRRAKDYFAEQIAEAKAEKEKMNKDKETDDKIKKQMDENINTITKEYQTFMKEFQAQSNFINPYATYLSAVFFFLDKDYIKASDLLKEVVALKPNNTEFKKQYELFNTYANAVRRANTQKHIFVVYESGLGVVKDEVKLTLPIPVSETDVILVPFAMAKLKKRSDSFPYIVVNGKKTTELANIDNIVATEFKIMLPWYIFKSVASTFAKTAINIQSMRVGGGYLGLATGIFNHATTKADVRSWQGLPVRASIAMLPNEGTLKVNDDRKKVLIPAQKLNKNKNVLVIIRSFHPEAPSTVFVIEES